MKAMLYGIKVQLKIDIRSKTLLVTCYVVPLLFFAIMGGIFTSLMPEAKNTLIQSMTVMGVSMGAFIGVPPSMVEVYGTDIKKMYIANGMSKSSGHERLISAAFFKTLATVFLDTPQLCAMFLSLNPKLFKRRISRYLVITYDLLYLYSHQGCVFTV